MENRKDIKNPGQTSTTPTDKGEDSEERRNAAAQAWRDKQGIPRGTPEQGEERSAEPEIEDDANESATKRAPEVDDVGHQEEKRRAAPEQPEPDGPSGEGTGPKTS